MYGMKSRSSSAFTLLELITVMAIIAILTGIVVGISGHVQGTVARRRALAEMTMLNSAIENYRAETGCVPQNTDTDFLSPKNHFDPRSPDYESASLYLYQELTGDKSGPGGTGAPDGVPDEGAACYLKQFDPRILKADRDPDTHRITRVHGFQDPWGFYYGYSTAHLAAEQAYRRSAGTGGDPQLPTGDKNPGYNSPGPDLWSTAGTCPATPPTSQTAKDELTMKWVKDW